MQTKTELRRLHKQRLPLPPHERAEKSARICEAIRSLPEWKNARSAAIFCPLASEPDVELLWNHRDGRNLSYPRIEGESLRLYSVESLYELVEGGWGVREPMPNKPAQDVDIIIVPGIAFGRNGARCGRGKGHYDRLLSWLPVHLPKVGVCFARQIADDIPTESHDVFMDVVVTEDGPIRRG